MIIYRATNTVNGKCYIGQTKQEFVVRKKQHIYRSKKKISNTPFHNALLKYGVDNFIWDILCECISHEELDEMEFHYIKQYHSHIDENGYNLNDGGYGNHGLCKESRKKISNAFKGEKHPQWGKRGKGTPMYGKTHTDETKKRMSDSASGNGNSQWGKKQTSEHIEKRLAYLKDNGSPRSKEYIITTPEGIEIKIKSMNKYCKEHGLKPQNMYTVASGGQKTHWGYKCVRVDE